ncbi:hypothetical protein N7490_003039 [Penicillium lividum]|nr:hypothetical protein N7490_003039 [Penicillium lividum]
MPQAIRAVPLKRRKPLNPLFSWIHQVDRDISPQHTKEEIPYPTDSLFLSQRNPDEICTPDHRENPWRKRVEGPAQPRTPEFPLGL